MEDLNKCNIASCDVARRGEVETLSCEVCIVVTGGFMQGSSHRGECPQETVLRGTNTVLPTHTPWLPPGSRCMCRGLSVAGGAIFAKESGTRTSKTISRNNEAGLYC